MTTLLAILQSPFLAPALAMAAAGMLVVREFRDRRDVFELLVLFVVAPLAALATLADVTHPAAGVVVAGVSIALLSRHHDSALHSECALKLLWVLGAALALSWIGELLLALATGTAVISEQWAVLELGLDPSFLWATALPLSLLAGFVFLGGAPFHFWPSDVLHGVRPWLAPFVVVALQVGGAGWLARRLAGIGSFTPAAELVSQLIAIGIMIAFAVGAVTLLAQRRSERRVGTLATFHGALLLVVAVYPESGAGGPITGDISLQQFSREWAGHLLPALVGAVTMAGFVPLAGTPSPGSVLFRRHPLSALAGLFAFFSLAGFPGTPGAELWLEAARHAVRSGRVLVIIALGAGWLAAIGVAAREARDAFGVASEQPLPPRNVPRSARGAMWVAALGVIASALR
jgi:NADH:ubiquinone oxidoreductase subunit 2 (subunit N)